MLTFQSTAISSRLHRTRTMKLATFLFPTTVCLLVLFAGVSCTSTNQEVATSTDPVGSLTIQNLEMADISQEDLKTIRHCVATAFQVPYEQDADVEATIVSKNHIKTSNASLRRGLYVYDWLFDIFILLFHGCADCLSHEIDDDMLFLRRLSSATTISDGICDCLQSSDHSNFSTLKPNDCLVELKEDQY